jgi:hypothetical protein
MLMDFKLIDIFGVQAVHTVVDIQNKGILRNNIDKNPHDLWKGRPTNVNHLRVFGSKFYFKRKDGKIRKFESLVDKGIHVGYSRTMKEYKFFNIRLKKIVESINVMFYETGARRIKEEGKDSME